MRSSAVSYSRPIPTKIIPVRHFPMTTFPTDEFSLHNFSPPPTFPRINYNSSYIPVRINHNNVYVSQLKIINPVQSTIKVDSTLYERRPGTSTNIISVMESIENYFHIVRLLLHEFSISFLRPVILTA